MFSGLQPKLGAVTADLNNSERLLTQLTALVDCKALHYNYLNATRGLCESGLLGLCLMLLASFTAAILLTIMVSILNTLLPKTLLLSLQIAFDVWCSEIYFERLKCFNLLFNDIYFDVYHYRLVSTATHGFIYGNALIIHKLMRHPTLHIISSLVLIHSSSNNSNRITSIIVMLQYVRYRETCTMGMYIN